jgi:hypothetical protein
MDVVSLSKASKALRNIQDLNNQVVAPLAESRFPTVDARLDWLEGQASQLKVENSLQLDLSQGTFTNTELVDGKIQLKQISTTTKKGTTNFALNSTVLSSATAVNNISYVFDGNLSTKASTNSGNNISSIVFKVNKKIKPYQIKATQQAGNSYSSSIKFWGYNDDTATWDKLTPISMAFASNATTTLTFDIDTNNLYDQFKYESSGTGYVSTPSSIFLNEIEVYAWEGSGLYVSSGTYESPIIDLGEGWNKTGAVDIQKFINIGTTNSIMEIAISTDGSTFSEYALLDPATPPQGRYVKIRATLSATPLANPSTTTQYDQSPETKVTLNEYSEATGDLKLKTSYIYPMNSLSQDADGQIIKATIPKNSFQSISKLEVK